MPVRNAGAYLSLAVDSILAQSHTDFELLIVDDHSDDDALSKLANDPRLRIIANTGQGLVDALNTGLNSATHSIIARMDGDDIAHPERLSRQLEFLQSNPQVDICGCRVEMFAVHGVAQGYALYQQWINSLLTHEQIVRDLFIESPIAHPSVMFRAQVGKALNGYQDGDWPEDYDFWCRAMLAGFRFGKVAGEPLLQWRDYPDRTSRTDSRYQKSGFIECKARTLAVHLNQKGIKQVIIWGVGPTGLKLHDHLISHGIDVDSFIDINPKMAKRHKRGKQVLIVDAKSDTMQSPDGLLKNEQMLICAVSARGARQEIRDLLHKSGWSEGQNFIMAA